MLNSTIQNGFIMSFLKHIVQCTVGGGGGGRIVRMTVDVVVLMTIVVILVAAMPPLYKRSPVKY
jgi:hypothetical protein